MVVIVRGSADQSMVCQDISKVLCFLNNTTDISVLIGIFRNSVKVPCFVNLLPMIYPRENTGFYTHEDMFTLIRAFSDFKAFLYILIGGFSVRGCYHIKTPNFPLPCGRGPTSLPS